MKIVPRNAIGWLYLLYWVLLFSAIIGVNLWVSAAIAANRMNDRQITLIMVPKFLMITTIWTVPLICWTKNRSEIIDMNELIALKRDHDKAQKMKRR